MFHEALRIAGLAAPTLGMQLTAIGMMSIDSVMAGRFGTSDLAAIGIGSALYVALLVILTGIANGITPVAARLWGSGAIPELRAVLSAGMVLSIGCALLSYPLLMTCLAMLIDTDPVTMGKTGSFLGVLSIGLPALLAYRLLFAMEAATGRPAAFMWINIAGLILKVPLNFALMSATIDDTGERLGVVGCAASSVIISWASLAICCHLLRRSNVLRGLGRRQDLRISLTALKLVLQATIPVSAVQFVEIVSFSGMAILIASAGSNASAAHQIAANIATLVFMLPLSVAIASGALIARSAGASAFSEEILTFRAGLLMACSLAAATTVGLLLGRSAIAALFTADADVAALASRMLFWVAASQMADAIQIYFCVVLRSYRIAWPAVAVAVVLRCGLGLGLGAWMAFRLDGFGPVGVWIGGFIALCAAALAIGAIFHRKVASHRRLAMEVAR
ncbi:putative multidrug resistance protein NorM [Cupriavidus taiwanensis]|uniref:MATE family efflux transporter n=1 Tax=Cupriavidus taiwanensis TaxID=164546 RepID=UPI000E1633DF|nr:MATE family efflux transporter [Cupriavidus taiwanensis]SPA36842.1 putative multidrug resistance protein NorM [Cupriavidus taiwanensis]